jgi:hypothetical protein
MNLTEDEVTMVQTDGEKRQVYIKVREYQKMCEILTTTQGKGKIRRGNGEMSTVRIDSAGMGIKRVRLANIPPEIPDRTIQMVLEKYAEVKRIRAETWSRTNRYPVENGIRAASVALVAHIPSHLMVAGHRSLVSYDGQPPTCYGCNEKGHIYMECPKRRRVEVAGEEGRSQSWADVAARGRMQQAGEEPASEGCVDEPKRSSEEPRTNENERDVEELEEIMEVQEMEEMVSEEVSRGEDEEKSTERKGMEPSGENKKAEGGHGGDTRNHGNLEERG